MVVLGEKDDEERNDRARYGRAVCRRLIGWSLLTDSNISARGTLLTYLLGVSFC